MASTSRSSPTNGTPGPQAASRRILVVEDDYDIRIGVARVLRDEGYEVEVVADGEDARAAVNRDRPGLILLDLMLPVVSGQELLQELRASGNTVPVVVITAAPNAANVRGLPVLVKPLNVDDLLRAARTYLG